MVSGFPSEADQVSKNQTGEKSKVIIMSASEIKIKSENSLDERKDRIPIRNPKSAIQNRKTWLSVDLDRIDYREAWELQGNLIKARKEHTLKKDIVLFLEHPSVFTLGRRGGRECLLVSEEFLEKAGVQVIQVERGGNITFHGPGQLVVYPIVDLQTGRITQTFLESLRNSA